LGFIAPPIQIEGQGYNFSINALNKRGELILSIIKSHLISNNQLFSISDDSSMICIQGFVIQSSGYFSEEERSKQPSLFSLVRSIKELFSSKNDDQLGLYGAFGYDLTFQFEKIDKKKERLKDQRDLVLYLPDQILVVDNQKNNAWIVQYDFSSNGQDTYGIERATSFSKFLPDDNARMELNDRDSPKGSFAKYVNQAKEEFKVGNLFEVVLSQVFRRRLNVNPSRIFRR
jgi:anthranilate synthase